MRRNLREDVDVWGNYGKIWTRRYAGGGGKWEDLSESEKIRRQSQLREQAIAAGMPEDMSAMSPPPTVSAVSAGATAGLKAGKYTFPGDSRADMDEARRLADMRIAKSHMEQIEAQRQQKIEKQQRDMLEAAKKEIAQRRVDRAERQFQIAKDVYNKGGDVQELSDRIRLDLLRELSDSFWDETPSAQANANADSGVWGYSPDDLTRMKQQEQAKKWAEQYNDVAGKMQTSFAEAPKFTADQINAASAGLGQGYEPVGASPFTAGQINEASEGLQSTAADKSGVWGLTEPELQESKEYQRQKQQEHREVIRAKANKNQIIYNNQNGKVAVKHKGKTYEVYIPDTLAPKSEEISANWKVTEMITIADTDFNWAEFIKGMELEEVTKEPIYAGDVQVADNSGTSKAAGMSLFSGILNSAANSVETKRLTFIYEENGDKRRLVIRAGSRKTTRDAERYADNTPRLFTNTGDPYALQITLDSRHKYTGDASYVWINSDGTFVETPIVFPNDKVTFGKTDILGLGFVFEPIANVPINTSTPVSSIYQAMLTKYLSN